MKRLYVLLAVVLETTASVTAAQRATGELGGTVVDQQGSILRGVALTIRNQSTGTFRETRTADDGSYFVSALAPGLYEVRATLPAFRTSVRTNVPVEVGRTTIVDLKMTLGPVTESVVVHGDTPLLDVTSKQVGGHITSHELVELPSANRSFVGFIGLLPGIVPIPSDAFGADAISVNGIDPRSNNYLLDGTNNNDDFLGQRAGTQVRTPIEAIEEFQVLTHQFDAEFGRATGAVINAVTRQGANAFRGSAFAFFQDDAMTSRDFFARQNDLPQPDTVQQQYGGTVGGRIVRDRAHFFGSVERVTADRATSVNIPARPALNAAATTEGRVWNTIVRVDHQLDARQQWGVRWLRESSPQENLLLPAAGRQSALAAVRAEADVDQALVGAVQSVLGNTRVNTLRLGFTREDVAFASPGFNGNGRRQDLLPPTLQYPTFIDQQSEVAQARINNAYSVEDTFGWFLPGHGRSHDVKLGVQYQFATADSTNQTMMNGVFEFRTAAPFNATDPATYPERLQVRVPGSGESYMKGHFVSAFAQDRWRLRPDLTLSLGLRYDIEVIPLREEHNPAFPDASRYPVDRNNVAPRLGFAYAPGGKTTSIIRGGYGVFYDKTHFELISSVTTAGVFSDSFIASFPANGIDPGPSQGTFPSDPLLRNGPTLDAARLRQLFPRGARIRNSGTVYLDSPDRRVPKSHQVTLGYARQLGSSASASVDYVHASGRDLLVGRELNPGTRPDPSPATPLVRINPAFTSSVLQYVNVARTGYDALEVHVQQRLRRGFSARVSYTLASSRGNASGNGSAAILLQRVDDPGLAANEGPTDFDRRHNFVASGTARLPGTGGVTVSAIVRAMSGLPFSLIDSTLDQDRNGILFDFVPPGTYQGAGRNAIAVDYGGGRNGAYGPGIFQVDVRGGYRRSAGGARTLELFGEILNATNRAAFDNPVALVVGHPAADRRLTDFLVLRSLRPGAIPRTGQIGIRFTFRGR
jgi:hypothetical protein